MTLGEILKMLAGPDKKRSAAQLRDALAKVDLPALEAKVSALEAERQKLLIHGSDQEIASISQDVAAANLQLERGIAAKAELERAIAEAEKREADAAISSTLVEADAVRAQSAASQAELDKTIAKAAALLAAMKGQHNTLGALNKKIEAAGRKTVKATPIEVIRRRAVDGLRAL